MNTFLKPKVLSCLHIWQQNTRKSLYAQQYILSTNPSLFDLILIQEPWIDSQGNIRGNHHWCILCPSNKHLDGQPSTRSIILVNTNISTDSYTALDIPNNDITAIQLKGEFGHCTLFNVYNDCTNNCSTDALKLYLDTNPNKVLPHPLDHMFWCGNFNRHHPLWEEDKNCRLFNNNNLINPLLDLINEHEMVLALPPGIST